jgi:hypothetical protein
MWSCERSTTLGPYDFNFDLIKIFEKEIFLLILEVFYTSRMLKRINI